MHNKYMIAFTAFEMFLKNNVITPLVLLWLCCQVSYWAQQQKELEKIKKSVATLGSYRPTSTGIFLQQKQDYKLDEPSTMS